MWLSPARCLAINWPDFINARCLLMHRHWGIIISAHLHHFDTSCGNLMKLRPLCRYFAPNREPVSRQNTFMAAPRREAFLMSAGITSGDNYIRRWGGGVWAHQLVWAILTWYVVPAEIDARWNATSHAAYIVEMLLMMSRCYAPASRKSQRGGNGSGDGSRGEHTVLTTACCVGPTHCI